LLTVKQQALLTPPPISIIIPYNKLIYNIICQQTLQN